MYVIWDGKATLNVSSSLSFSFFEIGTPNSVVRTDITKLVTYLFSYAVTLVIKSDFVSYGAFSILDTMA